MCQKVITLIRPWCWAIVHGTKRVENRTWGISYRGPLLIHSGLKWDADGERFVRQQIGHCPTRDQWPGGQIVGVARLDRCWWLAKECPLWSERPTEWHFGPCCWELSDVIALAKPIEIAGERGLWTPPDWVIAEVRRQTEEARK